MAGNVKQTAGSLVDVILKRQRRLPIPGAIGKRVYGLGIGTHIEEGLSTIN